MAENFSDTIIIKFKPEGDQRLITAIKALDRATKSMLKTQASMADYQKSGYTQTEKGRASYIRLKNIMLSYGKSLKDVTKDENLLTLAKKGDTVATMKLGRAVRKYTRDLDRNKKSIVGTVHDTRILGGSFAVLRSKMLLVSFASSIVGATIGKLTKTYGEQEKAERTLSTAIGYRSQALLDFASAQQRVTIYGDEETISVMALIGAYTNNEDSIKKLTIASMNLASAKRMDLRSAVDLVSKSVFSSTNALSRYGVTIEGASGSTERLSDAVNVLGRMYGGQAKAEAETFLGSLSQLGNSAGDVAEKFGLILAPSIQDGAVALKEFSDSLSFEDVANFSRHVVATASALGLYKASVLIATTLTNGFTLSLVTLKTALIKTGIGVIVVAYGYFIDKLLQSNSVLGVNMQRIAELTKKKAELGKEIANLNRINTEYQESLDAIREAEENRLKSDHDKLESLQDEVKQIILKRAELEKLSPIEIAKLKYGEKFFNQYKGIILQYLKEKNELNALIYLEKKRLELKKDAIKTNDDLAYAERRAMEQAGMTSGGAEGINRAMQYMIDKKKERLELENLFASQAKGITNALRDNVNQRMENEITALKATDKYKNASMEQRENMENKVARKYANRQKALFIIEKTARLADIYMNVASATIKAMSLGQFQMIPIIQAMGAIQAGVVLSTPAPQAFANGGDFVTNKPELIMVGEAGREHVQITPIDRPESRALKGGGDIVLNISAPLVDETVIDSIIPAIKKAQRMNLA